MLYFLAFLLGFSLGGWWFYIHYEAKGKKWAAERAELMSMLDKATAPLEVPGGQVPAGIIWRPKEDKDLPN